MCKPMPYKLIKKYNDMSHIKLENFFGFALAEITTPKNILKPLLPYKYEGKTIFPTGRWVGVYFSEELKKVQSKGYKIKLIKGSEYSQINLFNKYVEHFYHKKKKSDGPKRFIAKMHLNQLYGIFGRKQETIETLNIYNKDLDYYLSTRIVKSITHINKDISTILIKNNINSDIINDIKPIINHGSFIDLKFKFDNKYILYFRDTYLLLPASLKKLAINFNVQQKGIFPHLFVNNSDIILNYIGKVPEYKYFNKD
jgi:hypothetical protein